MGLAAKVKPHLAIPKEVGIPDAETRKLRARLIYEEAMETVRGLGCRLNSMGMVCEDPEEDTKADLKDIIDGCCDLIYVAVGTLASCGIPDLEHLQEVCRANDSKFPGNKPILDAGGKFLKPDGWQAPDHQPIIDKHGMVLHLLQLGVLADKGVIP